MTVITPQWTLVTGQSPHEPELYDRKSDPTQITNVASQHPDLVRELRLAAGEFMTQRGAEPEYVKAISEQ